VEFLALDFDYCSRIAEEGLGGNFDNPGLARLATRESAAIIGTGTTYSRSLISLKIRIDL